MEETDYMEERRCVEAGEEDVELTNLQHCVATFDHVTQTQ